MIKESCAKSMQFCYGHRVHNHEGKCKNLHGHNGQVIVYATPIKGRGLDECGRVIDFSVIKQNVGEWIETNWDHTLVLNREDKETIKVIETLPSYAREKKIYLLPSNPTAENMAKYLLLEVAPKVLKGCGVIVYKVEFFETPTSLATVEVDPNCTEIQEKYL